MTDSPKVLQVQYNASKTGALFHHSTAFFRGIRGPIGSGKSVTCCFEIFANACNQKPGPDGVRRTRWAAIRNTLPELKSTTLKTWLSWFPEGDPRKDKSKFGILNMQSPITHHVRYSLPDGTKVELEMIFLALDQASDVKKLLSLELTGIWFNEAREILKDHIDGGTGRVGRFPASKDGGCTRKAIIADTNAPDEEHWWAELEENTPENWAFFSQPGGLDVDAENLENLDQGGYKRLFPDREYGSLTFEERRRVGRLYYEDMLGGKDPEWINVYVHNQFGTIMRGVPVYAADWNRDIHLAKSPIIIVPRSEIVIGVDCSGRHPAAVFSQYVGRARLQTVKELCIMDDEGMGAEKFADYFVQKIDKWFKGCAIDEIWGDPAGGNKSQNDERTYFDILNDALKKYQLKVKPAPGLRFPDRYEAVQYLLSNLVDGKPMVEISPDCRYLVQGFNGKYMFKEINTAGGGTRVDDRPVKNRHSNPHDAFQYMASGVRERRAAFKKARRPRQVQVVRPKASIF